MPKFRKKPVVIEAFRMTEARRDNNIEWPDWLHKAWNIDMGEPGSLHPAGYSFALTTKVTPMMLAITTLEGPHLVSWGDWIIQGVQGELYPCKHEIFQATYEPVED